MCSVLDREMVAGKDGFVVWEANGWILVLSLVPSMNSWHSLYTIIIIFSLLIYLLINSIF